MNKEILVDVDDVLSQTQRKIINFVNQNSKKKLHLADFGMDIREGQNPEIAALIQKWLQMPELVIQTIPFPRAKDGLELLYKADFNIHIVSSRKEPLHTTTSSWLERHGFSGYINEIHRRPNDLSGAEFKLQIARKTGASFAYDDTYSVIEKLAGNNVFTFIINKPWNRSVNKLPNSKRVKSFYQGVKLHLDRLNR